MKTNALHNGDVLEPLPTFFSESFNVTVTNQLYRQRK